MTTILFLLLISITNIFSGGCTSSLRDVEYPLLPQTNAMHVNFEEMGENPDERAEENNNPLFIECEDKESCVIFDALKNELSLIGKSIPNERAEVLSLQNLTQETWDRFLQLFADTNLVAQEMTTIFGHTNFNQFTVRNEHNTEIDHPLYTVITPLEEAIVLGFARHDGQFYLLLMKTGHMYLYDNENIIHGHTVLWSKEKTLSQDEQHDILNDPETTAYVFGRFFQNVCSS